jgi:hypothetical protein
MKKFNRKLLPQMISMGLREAVQSKRKQVMSEQPIPVFERVVCKTCGRTGVSQIGSPVLCETCVNTFLAKNVGLMQPAPAPEEKEYDIDHRIPKD